MVCAVSALVSSKFVPQFYSKNRTVGQIQNSIEPKSPVVETKDFINIQFLQKLSCQKPFKDKSSLVNKRFWWGMQGGGGISIICSKQQLGVVGRYIVSRTWNDQAGVQCQGLQ